MSIPIEMNVIEAPGILLKAESQPYWKIYSAISEEVRKIRIIHKDSPYVGITEHAFDEGTKLAIMINYSPSSINTSILLKEGWKVDKVVYGEDPIKKYKAYECSIAANDAMILYIKRE